MHDILKGHNAVLLKKKCLFQHRILNLRDHLAKGFF